MEIILNVSSSACVAKDVTKVFEALVAILHRPGPFRSVSISAVLKKQSTLRHQSCNASAIPSTLH